MDRSSRNYIFAHEQQTIPDEQTYICWISHHTGWFGQLYVFEAIFRKRRKTISPTACHVPQLHQCRKCVSCRSCRLKACIHSMIMLFIGPDLFVALLAGSLSSINHSHKSEYHNHSLHT